MICRSWKNREGFNYRFLENEDVELENARGKFAIPYNEWLRDYYIIDKWDELKL